MYAVPEQKLVGPRTVSVHKGVQPDTRILHIPQALRRWRSNDVSQDSENIQAHKLNVGHARQTTKQLFQCSVEQQRERARCALCAQALELNCGRQADIRRIGDQESTRATV